MVNSDFGKEKQATEIFVEIQHGLSRPSLCP